jgi:hypothetical protein
LAGTGTHPSISLSQSSLEFGIVALGDSSTADLWARNTGTGDLVLSGAAISDPRFSLVAPALPQTISEDDSVQVTVKFLPDQAGPITGTLTLTSNDPVHGQVNVPLTGSGPVPDIHIPLPSIDFGEALAGLDTIPGSVAITNRGTLDLQVTGLSFENDAFTLLSSAPFTVTPGDTETVSLIFHPASEDLYEDYLQITSNDPDPQEATVLVDLTGQGVMPILTLPADSLIAEAFEDGTAEEVLLVINGGSGTLTFEVAEADPSVPTDLPWLDVSPDSGSIASGDTLSLAASFDPEPVGHGVFHGRLLFSSNDPTTGQREVPVILRVPRMHYADLDTGNVRLTVTDEGALGFFDKGQMNEYGDGYYGSGFHFPAGDPNNHLFSGSIWLGREAAYVADASYDYDWEVIPGGVLAITHESGQQVARARMNDANGATPLNLTVQMTAMAAPDPPDDDYVLIELVITNPTGSAVEGLYAGFYMDWDVGNLYQNIGGYLGSEEAGYLTDPVHPDSCHVGLVAIDPMVPAAFRLIHNPTYVHPYEEVRDQDAFAFMSSATIDSSTSESSEWSMAMANGPYTLAAGDSVRVAMAVVAGEGLADFAVNAHQARTAHSPTAVAWDDGLPITRFALGKLFPNPFNPSVSFCVDVPRPGGFVSVKVYDLRGRLVDRILDGELPPGRHVLTWRGQDEAGRQAASGLYFFRMVAGDVVDVRKALLLK